jgi:hypothetical protein
MSKKSEQDIIAEAIDLTETAIVRELVAEGIKSNVSESHDFECEECDSKGTRSTDSQLEREHRQARHKEFMGLKNLPFHSEKQAKRLEVLKSLRVRDNKHAFKSVSEASADLTEAHEPGSFNEFHSLFIRANKIKKAYNKAHKDGANDKVMKKLGQALDDSHDAVRNHPVNRAEFWNKNPDLLKKVHDYGSRHGSEKK